MESIVERQQALTARLQSYKDIEELHHCFEFCSNRRLRHWIQRKRYALHKVYDNTSPNAVEDLKAEWKHYDDCMVEEKEDTEVGEEEDDDSDGDEVSQPPACVEPPPSSAITWTQFFPLASSSAQFVLIVGLEGSGKSHLCRSIASQMEDVLMPQLPGTFGTTVGDTERALLHEWTGHRVLILDSIDCIEPPSLLCTLLDTTKSLVLCTSTRRHRNGRWDWVEHLPATPSASKRNHLLRSWCEDYGLPPFDETMIEITEGKSYSDLMYHARKAAADMPSFWDSFRTSLQQSVPPSLKVSDGLADMQVHTSRDLQSWREPTPPFASSETAWPLLISTISAPLCHAKKLASMLGTTRAITHGLLLTGPSGSGKTTLAWKLAAHVAQQLPNVQFIVVSCNSLIHKEVGRSEEAIQHVFQAMTASQSPCMLLLDHLEVIATVRGNDTTTEGTMDRVLSTLLVEMDGLESRDSPLAVVGVTQHEEWIDPAVRRPGRLSRTIQLSC